MFAYPKKTKLTQTEIDRLPLSSDGRQVTVYDTSLPGFALRIGATSKSFIVYKRLANGDPKRITLGKYGQLTLTQARSLAQAKLADLTSGVDPNTEKKAKREANAQSKARTSETVQWLIDEYKNEHLIGNKGGKETTLASVAHCYNYFAEKHIVLLTKLGDKWTEDKPATLSNWLERPFRDITREDILSRFNMLNISKPTRVRKETGLQPIVRTHQVCFKFLSAAYNYVITKNELDIKENFRNPVDILVPHKKWKKTEKRTRMLEFRKEEFALWWRAAIDYRSHNSVASDYIIFSLLQAGRSIEIAPLKWSSVDLGLEEISYSETKNDLDYKFPITKLGLEILQRRKKFAINEYVFGYKESKTHHIPQDAKFHFKNISEACGKLISHHDLRRTWGTSATFLNIDERIIDFCLKHKIDEVSERYLMRHYSIIKAGLQKVEDFFLSQTDKLADKETTPNDTK